MGEKRAAFIALLFCFCLLVFASGIAFASSENWSEITRFTGASEFIITEQFTCDHVEWRIRWEFEPSGNGSAGSLFKYDVYENESKALVFESEPTWWTKKTNDTSYINKNGTFFMRIMNTGKSYTLIIEQNLMSIPEFPSWVILPLFLTATLSVIVFKKRLFRSSP